MEKRLLLDRTESVDGSSVLSTNNPADQFSHLVGANYACQLVHFLPELLHEANNELAILQGNGELLCRNAAPAVETVARRGSSVLKAVGRLITLNRFLERNPSGSLSADSCELIAVVGSFQSECSLLNDFDHLQWRVEPSEPLSVRVPGWIVKQILLNLVTNSLRRIFLDQAGGELSVQFTSADETASLHWSDNGFGFDDGIMNRLGREPFGAQGEHAGIGLYVCAELIRRAGGSIEFHAGPGAMVSITLPRSLS